MRKCIITLEVISEDQAEFYRQIEEALRKLYSHTTFRTLSVEFKDES